jgi:hypothetical protein
LNLICFPFAVAIIVFRLPRAVAKFKSINAVARSVPNKQGREILLLAGHKQGATSLEEMRANFCATTKRKQRE